MKSRHRSPKLNIIALLFLLIALTGCGLLSDPPQPVIPTPIPTAPPFGEILSPQGEPVTDPVSDIVPRVDADIAGLINAVSQQQLMAYVQTLENFGTRNSFSETESDTFGIGAARRWIADEFTRVGNGRINVVFDEFDLSYNGYTAPQSNVVATLPGNDPEGGIIVISAHYDTRPVSVTDGFSRSTGANDNASGVALLLETARLMSSRQWDQTVVFIAMAAEEQGTFGSRHYAQNAFLDNKNILAVLTYDAVGGRNGIRQTARIFAPELRQSPTGALARYYDFISGIYLPTFPVTIIDALDREGRWGDHREFINVGMPAVRVMESEEDPDLVNSTLDTWSLIDYDYFLKIAQLNVAVVASAAGSPTPPDQPTIVSMADPGAYLLTWPVKPNVAGYAIAFRPLDSASYPPFRFVRANRAGNVVLTGLDPNVTYAVSLAALNGNGRLGYFSPEIIVGPPPTQDLSAVVE